METDKTFFPDPRYKIFVYPIIPLEVIKKFIALLPETLNKWPKNTTANSAQFYALLSTFINSFKLEDMHALIDKPDNEQFATLLETNPLYAPSKGGMVFCHLTPIYVFRRWLLSNLYEGPPLEIRHDYKEGVFDEKGMKIICGHKFGEYKDINERLRDFVSDFENQTLDKFINLTRRLFCFPLEDL
jgi:hypothetical protein